jgi:acyl dehydratase
MVRSLTTDPETGRRYADASGDHNPIHVDDAAAQSVGLPGAIVHGFWIMAQLARAATDAAGGDPLRLRRMTVEFRGYGVIGRPIVAHVSVERPNVVAAAATQDGRRLTAGGQAELGDA